MSPGEKAIWAATYGAVLAAKDLVSMSTDERSAAVTEAVSRAHIAVVTFRVAVKASEDTKEAAWLMVQDMAGFSN